MTEKQARAQMSTHLPTPVLAGIQLTRKFGGLVAVDQVDIAVAQRSIAGIIGPNGAGKTTLLNLLSGAITPTSGQVMLDNTDVTKHSATKRATAGLRRTFQNIRLFTQMTLLDNVLVGQHSDLKGWLIAGVLRPGPVRKAEQVARERARDTLHFVGLGSGHERLAGELSYGDQRRLEMARALAARPRVLLLDEPAAGLNSSEKSRVADLILRLPEEFDLSVVLVEHDMDLVSRTCGRVTVLDYGQLLCDGLPTVVLKDPRVIEAYIGTDEDDLL